MVRTKTSGRAAPSAAATTRGPLRTITQRRPTTTATNRASASRRGGASASRGGGAAARRRTPATTSRNNPSLVARAGRAVRVRAVVHLDSSADSSIIELDDTMSARSYRQNSPGLDDSFEMDDSRLLEPNHYVEDSFVVGDDDSNLSDSDGSTDSFDSDSNEDLDLLQDDVDSSRAATPAPEIGDALQESVIRSSEHGHCNICFEDAPYDPVGCLICRQLIGCKNCVTRWYETGKKKKARQEESAENHFMCPLCRHPWEHYPEVDSIFFLDS